MTAATTREFLTMCVEMFRRNAGTRDTAPPYYLGPMDLVLREGEEFTPAPYDVETWGHEGTPRNCFEDALLLALRWPSDLTYVEGYAASELMGGIHHAWCVESDGTVVDATWGAARPEAPGLEYLGIRFPLKLACEIVTEKETYGVLDHKALYKRPLAETLSTEGGTDGTHG